MNLPLSVAFLARFKSDTDPWASPVAVRTGMGTSLPSLNCTCRFLLDPLSFQFSWFHLSLRTHLCQVRCPRFSTRSHFTDAKSWCRDLASWLRELRFPGIQWVPLSWGNYFPAYCNSLPLGPAAEQMGRGQALASFSRATCFVCVCGGSSPNILLWNSPLVSDVTI